jgi:vancomycin resistance protein YoaR
MAKGARAGGARRRRGLVVAAGIVVGLGLLLVLASAAEHMWYSGSVLPGVHLDGAQIGGRSDAKARAALEQLATRLQSTPIRAHAGNRTFTVDPSLIGFRVDIDATMRQARDTGRDANPVHLVSDTIFRRFRPDVVHLVVRYDPSGFEGLLDGWANVLDSGVVEGALRFSGTTVIPVEPHAGHGMLRADAARELRKLLAGPTRTDLDLPIGTIQPQIDQAAVDDAARRAREVLAGTYVVAAGARRVTLSPRQIAPLVDTQIDGNRLDLTIDADKLRFTLGPAFTPIERQPVDATFDVSNPDDVKVIPSVDGRELDTTAIGAAIIGGQHRIAATIRDDPPAHDTKWARALGIEHEVSSFTTYHDAGEPRVVNIHLAANVLNNTVVEPGQTFSLNQKLGPRTPEKGYVKAPVILEGGFGEDYGGGISQLTTTLYNAVFFGGYVDVDHSPHHYYISRYPMGREATIVWPYIDLKFRDDTKHGVLIRTSYTDTSITVTFYGDTDGRTVREENRKILHTEPTTDRLVACSQATPTDDPNDVCASLRAPERELVATGETGYDVEFDRVIDQPGHAEVRQHYRVHYPMLPNTVLVGSAPAPTPSSTTTTTGKPTMPSTSPPTSSPTSRHPAPRSGTSPHT